MGPQERDKAIAARTSWLLNLLSITDLMLVADTKDDMAKIASRIKDDELLTARQKDMLRLIFHARLYQIEGDK